MNALPIRIFHAILSGIVIGALLSIAGLQLMQRSTATPTDDAGTGVSAGGTTTSTSNNNSSTGSGTTDPNDADGDGIPNDWESRYHHNPNDVSDAGADFDNDGLTALEEYRLNVQTNGQAGNPLGKWKTEKILTPPGYDQAWFYPVDINNNGDILVNGGIIQGGVWRSASFFVDSSRVWTEIAPAGTSSTTYLWVNDFNDKGEVVGSRCFDNWSGYESFIWDRVAGYRPFTYGGRRAYPWKINNYGDWIGCLEDPNTGESRPAYVVDGINMHASGDWWLYLWYTDINDFGEAMGSFYNPQTCRYNTLLAYGDWRFDTGLLGNMPFFDENSYTWSWSAAMNAYGEFTGGTCGTRQNQWSYLGYHFDGTFNEIKFAGHDLLYVSPESLNSSNTIVGYAFDTTGFWGSFIYRDGIGCFIRQMIPEVASCYSSRINNHGQIISMSGDGDMLLISPDQDQDGDGMSDDWESFHGLDKSNAADASTDADHDGTNNLGEYLLRSNPNAAPVLDPNGNEIDLRPGIDTDGDGIPNVWEWENGLDYQDASDAPKDFDRDGYTNLQEFRLNTDPRGAPSFRVREIGPFPGAASVSMSPATLGNGVISGSAPTCSGDNITESVFFAAQPASAINGGRRPAVWSIQRSEATESFSLFASHGVQCTQWVAQSPGGASLASYNYYPSTYVYWPSPTAAAIPLSGAASVNNIGYLYNAKLSPSGNYLVGTRSLASNSGIYEPIVWKMPTAGTQSCIPVKLPPPTGGSINAWTTLYVNDYGCIAGVGTINGQNRGIFWKINTAGTAVTASTLPTLSGGAWANVVGISNQDNPIIAGTSTVTGGYQRATLWKDGTAINLGTLAGGNFSTFTAISPCGSVAGYSNVLVKNALKYQPFISIFDPASSSWKTQAQGEPGNTTPVVQSVNDSGEILGYSYQTTPTYHQIPTLWRHGRAYPLDGILPASSGYTLDSIASINPHGTLLATTWKDGALTTVLLTPDRDTDGDGLPDVFENQYSFNPFVKNNPTTDTDSDGLSDLDEYRSGTHPRMPDTDSDGMKDGWEVSWGLLPLDPSDAPLDPDNDRVTNLRESQLGTTPTGIYKIESRFTDEGWSYPSVMAADDSGRIILSGQYQYDDVTEAEGFVSYSYRLGSMVLPSLSPTPAGTPGMLPEYSNFYCYNNDWTRYSYSGDCPCFFPNADSGSINADMQRYSGSYDGTNYSWNQTAFLIPDAANTSDESAWIPWDVVEDNLRNADSSEDAPPLSGSDTLNTYPDAVSPAGTRRIHHTAMGDCLVLNERGEFVGKLQTSAWWQKINDQGQAVAMTSRYVAASNGVSSYYAPELLLCSAGTVIPLPIPHDPGKNSGFYLQEFSEDGKVLLSQSIQNSQSGYSNRSFIYDINHATMTRVRQPGIGYESIASLSSENGRLLGSGNKPFQITPDGTCIRLDALRIKNTLAATPVTFGSLYPNSITPNHIASDGTITLTTYNNSYQAVILQIVPHNDADGDGIPDDWERDFAEQLAALGKSPSEWGQLYLDIASGNLNASADYTNDGTTLVDLFQYFENAPEQSVTCERRSYTAIVEGYSSLDVSGGFIDYEENQNASYIDWKEANQRYVTANYPDQLSESAIDTGVASAPWGGRGTRYPYPGQAGSETAGSSMLSYTRAEARYEPYRTLSDSFSFSSQENGSNTQTRFKFWRKHVSKIPLKFQFLLVTEEQRLEPWGIRFIPANESHVVKLESVEIEIDSKRASSDWFEIPVKTKSGVLSYRYLVPVGMAVDANRDGKIVYGSEVDTTAEKPFIFWVNDDHDAEHKFDVKGVPIITTLGQDDLSDGVKDFDDGKITCVRDLEDFSRLYLSVPSLKNQIMSGQISVGLELAETTDNPSMNVYRSVEEDGNMFYLLDNTVGEAQLAQDKYKTSLGTVSNKNIPKLPSDLWDKGGAQINFIFEASGEGKGKLKLVFYLAGQKVSTDVGVWTKFKNIKKMYQRWNAGEVEAQGIQWNVWPNATASEDKDSAETEPVPSADDEKDFVLFVHGWNMSKADKRLFAETSFKRMWQLGYKGKFGAFCWPTFYTDDTSSVLDSVDPRNFDGSEHRAWESSTALLGLLTQLNKKYPGRVHMLAHSMGNVVASEALHKAPAVIVKNYVASQAALPADVFKLNPDITSKWNTILAESLTGNGYKLPGAKAVTTPNIYAYYYPDGRDENYRKIPFPEWGKPYMNGIGGAEKWHNFINPKDWALALWIYNQSQKPHSAQDAPLWVWSIPVAGEVASGALFGYHLSQRSYEYKETFDGSHGFMVMEPGIGNYHGIYTPDSTSEIFSYCAQARCNPTGRQSNVGGPFVLGTEKNFSEFGDLHPGHSAQFLYAISEGKIWTYWHKILQECGIKHQNYP